MSIFAGRNGPSSVPYLLPLMVTIFVSFLQVLDPRTRMILFKMLNKKAISEINGCISTGKEANVYHATTPHGEHRAIKVITVIE